MPAYAACSTSCAAALEGGSPVGNPSLFAWLFVTFVLVYLTVMLLILLVPDLKSINTDFPGLPAILAWAAAAMMVLIVYGIVGLFKKKSTQIEPFSVCRTTSLWASMVMGTIVTGFGQYMYDRYISKIAL